MRLTHNFFYIQSPMSLNRSWIGINNNIPVDKPIGVDNLSTEITLFSKNTSVNNLPTEITHFSNIRDYAGFIINNLNFYENNFIIKQPQFLWDS